ncbi:MAG TPA: hypothetical protein ENI44_02310, partial [Thermoplasmatales archaeon]|nr:hypothetical protein [Thermoplasmatales archaeon]
MIVHYIFRVRGYMNRKQIIKLCYLTILLMLIPTFSPSNTDASNRINPNDSNDLLVREVAFKCYSPLFNSSERIKYYLEGMREGTIQSEKNVDPHTNSSNVEDSSVCCHSVVSDDGLMDSPWPMKCHDTKHTSLSPYSTSDNNGAILWKFRVENGIDAGIVVDDNGVVYFGCGDWYLYAVNPDGTLKWRY